ncbi:MAG: hypothetical protein OWT27_07180, partial [Firmicutes bacterium]|nr:hypothetical protein [Bacillota bacterium]
MRLYDADGKRRAGGWRVRSTAVAAAVALGAACVVSPAAAAHRARQSASATLLTEGQVRALVAKMGIVARGDHLLRSTLKLARSGEPARYDLSFAADAASRYARTYVVLSAHSGLLLSFSSPGAELPFRYPLPVARRTAQDRAIADAHRLYPALLKQVRLDGVASQPGSLRHALTWQFVFERVVDGIPAPFDGIRLTLNEYGQLIGASCRWTKQPFPKPTLRVTRAEADAIYRDNLHFALSYQPEWGEAGNQIGTVLAYADDIGSYPLDWDESYSVGQTVQGPVIDARTGSVIDSNGSARPLPAAAAVVPLVPNGPATNLTAR